MRLAPLLVALGACTPGPAPAPASPPPALVIEAPAPAEDACRERVAEMRPRLEQAAARPAQPLVDHDLSLPVFASDVGRELPEAVTVVVRPDRVTLNGNPASAGDLLVDLLGKMRKLYGILHDGAEPEGGFTAVVLASGDVDVAQVVPAVIRITDAGYLPVMAVRGPDAPPIETEPPTWVAEQLAQWDAGKGSPNAWRQAMTRAAGSCEAVMAVLETTGGDPTERVPRALLAMPDAVQGCGCDLDVDAVEALLVRFAVGRGRRYRALPVPHQVGAAPLAVERGSTVEALARRLAERPDPSAALSLVLEEPTKR